MVFKCAGRWQEKNTKNHEVASKLNIPCFIVVMPESNDDNAIFLGENSLIHCPARIEMRKHVRHVGTEFAENCRVMRFAWWNVRDQINSISRRTGQAAWLQSGHWQACSDRRRPARRPPRAPGFIKRNPRFCSKPRSRMIGGTVVLDCGAETLKVGFAGHTSPVRY